MALLARLIMIAMLGVLLLFLFGVTLIILIEGDHSALFDLVDLDEDLPNPSGFAAALGLFVMAMVLASLARAFWAVHRIMQNAVQSDFIKLADQLKICAISLIAFWVFIQVLLGPVSYALVWHIPHDVRPAIDYFPLDIEAIYLVLSLPLFVTAEALRRAADIEEENSQFL